MLAHFGKLTYPIYPYGSFFDLPVVAHPPVHLASIGLFARLGFTWYYAEATPTVLFFLLAILVIALGSFPDPVKLGLLFSIGFMVLTGEQFAVFFGTRPEGDVHAAWLAGLLLLESGRLDNWNRSKLFAGAFVLTWASGLHYYAGVAFTGIVVYAVWALRSLPWKDAKSRILAMCGGGCLFGIPYLTFFLVPNFTQILSSVRIAPGYNQGVSGSVRAQLSQYWTWAHSMALPALVRIPMKLGIPLFVFSTPMLALVRSTRGLALAALPLQLFVFLFVSHKQSVYMVHEVALFAAAAAVCATVLVDRLFSLVPSPRFQKLSLPLTAALLFFCLVNGNKTLRAAAISEQPRVYEAEVARAAARQILGRHARVAGRMAAWYSSGAEHWYTVDQDLRAWPYPPITYFSNFDAVVEYPQTSESAPSTISSWYASGALKLRGFYFGETNEQLQIVLLSPHPAPQVVGYASKDGQLYRFEQYPNGDYEVLEAVCPATPELQDPAWRQRWPSAFSSVLHLPQPRPDAPDRLVTVLTARRSAEPAGWIGPSCKEIMKLYGSISPTDRNALVDELRRTDTPMHFYELAEQVPGYVSAGLPIEMTPPKDCVRLDHVLKLSEIRANSPRALLDRTPPIRLTTDPENGNFSALIPVAHGESVITECWVQLRLKVETGAIGIIAFNNSSGIISYTEAPVLKSPEPIDVVLKVPNLRNADVIVLSNRSPLTSKVEILDATVLVTQQDWDRNQAVLASVR